MTEKKTLLVSRSRLAKLAGCSKANVTQRCRSELAAACVGQSVDVGHPAAAAFLERRGVRDEDLAAAAAATEHERPLISPGILKLELGQVLGLHDPRYLPGEPVRLAKLIRALRRMHAQLALNASARGDEQHPKS